MCNEGCFAACHLELVDADDGFLGRVRIVPHDTTIFHPGDNFLFVPSSVEYFLSGYSFDDHYERAGGFVRFLLLIKKAR